VYLTRADKIACENEALRRGFESSSAFCRFLLLRELRAPVGRDVNERREFQPASHGQQLPPV
jgi:hypothetical protein